MDLTDFMHGGPGRLWSCANCGLIVREEASRAHYQDDVYDTDLLNHLYPRYRDAFRAKESNYRHLLPARAEVLELGSHLGAFLEVAEEWGWRPTGLDIGESTSAFSRRRGLTVTRESLEDAGVPAHQTDALFIWNCFEQLEDPRRCLLAAHRVLKPGGLVIVRTPNVKFYARRRRHMKRSTGHRALHELAYNNLLGFPYLTGYDPGVLLRFLRQNGFEPLRGFSSAILTTPFPTMPAWVEREVEAAFQFAAPATLDGPWIEVVAAKSQEPTLERR